MKLQRLCNCGKRFTLTEGELEFFARKGFSIPKTCEGCRRKKKLDDETKARLDRERRMNSPFFDLLPRRVQERIQTP